MIFWGPFRRISPPPDDFWEWLSGGTMKPACFGGGSLYLCAQLRILNRFVELPGVRHDLPFR